tara:strand:+ start:2596 stop:5133 length:2538 start_codon:yes stop_codon:yes gene_type:complete
MSAKNLEILDLNLFSGSGEVFRTAVGGYYEIVSGAYGEEVDQVEYTSGSLATDFISSIQTNLNLEETISEDVVIPNKRFPVRLIGNETYVTNDVQWKAILLGGEAGQSTYSSIYTSAIFDEHSYNYSVPYTQVESISIPGGSSFTDVSQISYTYNTYLSAYQQYLASTIDSELLIPNMYLLKSFEMSMETGSAITLTSSIVDFVTLEGSLDEEEVAKIFTTSSILSSYYSASYPNTPLSSSTVLNMQNTLQNIFFDADYLSDGDSPYYEMESAMADIPFYNFIDFATATSGDVVESIENNNFSQKFLMTLKEIFTGENESLTPTNRSYVFNAEYYSGSVIADTVSTVRSAKNVTVRTVDFLKMLTYAYRNYQSMATNCYFYGGESFNRTAVKDKTGTYRNINAMNSTRVIDDTITYLENADNFEITSIEDLYNLENSSKETIAYRIEKIGGQPTGDSNTQNVLQNYWYFNSDQIDNLNFFDSQVKYGEDYTYRVYAYVLVTGKKYNFSDFRLSRQLGTTDLSTSEYPCLEFYDPQTGNPADQLLYGWEDNYLSGSNTYATNAQIIANNSYCADFYLNYEPNVRLFEIPMALKTLRVMDNPPNTFDVTPYHIKNTSQTIGFTIAYETFYDELSYPKTITDADVINKAHYLHGKDLLETSEITLESVSRQRYVDVFRLDRKPTALTDFKNNQVSRVEMKRGNEEFSYSTIDYRDRIKTNQKYYYLFRIVNDQGIAGPVSVIYEAQLVNDGGYVYSVFNILFEEELSREIFTEPFTQFKKLFQLRPNISHLILNTDDVDFNETAHSQLGNVSVGNADSTIWNKTFKLKITSRKTGKKIDLNVTYNLRS